MFSQQTGELVAPDPAQSWWRFVLCKEGASNFVKWQWPEQFECCEGGGVPTQLSDEDFVTNRKQWKAWHPKVLQVTKSDIDMVRDGKQTSADDFTPDWNRMQYRHVCPCTNNA